MKLKPDNIKSITEWKAFVREKTSIMFQAGSSGGKSKLSRVDVWTKAHKKKSGIPVTSKVGEALDKLKTVQQDPTLFSNTNVFEDALTVVLGPNRRGAIRGFGRRVNATKLELFSERDDNISRLEDKCCKIEEQGASTARSKEQSNEPILSPLDKLKTVQQDPTLFSNTNVFEDALTVVLGPNRRGAIRGFGRRVNATKLELFSERDDNISRLEDKCCKIEEQGASTVRSKEQSNEPILSPLVLRLKGLTEKWY
ncbi:hypothetical protein PanWU01x14_209250 [Parasponia andersonii]|uniref:Transposase, Ptta/En/Spm, plant n=1 Tax=Parasponia andersonii TaxID=3476 RepID=A0A2P5BUQ9_PARAD|nr:hypothetical protein PanWU01x14_209250 [Parasponia andersonii]